MSSSKSKPSVIVVMGVSGCGKSTVASLISQLLSCPFIEGDEYHSKKNIAKMRSGEPLTDTDRAEWLSTLAAIISTKTDDQFLIISCSALKPEYRRTLVSSSSSGTTNCTNTTKSKIVGFVLLEPTREELQQRIENRRGHFMPLNLLDSQLDTLNYSESELFMHLKPRIKDGLMPPAEELAAMVVDKLLNI